ncbi:hypothetical protein C3L33_15176, partial [Rhododendron williamsianum]
MACQVMHSWTFIGLVGAFLDLAIAYLLLCASTLAFFASKFLGFFGLSLPCPCNGLFGSPNNNNCVQRFLVDYPVESVSSVQLSVKSKFPFDSIWPKDRDYQLNLKLIRDRDKNCVNGFLEMEGKPSCSSMSGANVGERDLILRNESARGIDAGNELVHVKEGRFDIKGKGIVNQRPSSRLRRRRKICADYAKISPVLSMDPSSGDAESHSSINQIGNKAIECRSLPVDSGAGADRLNNDNEAPSITNFDEKASQGVEFSEPLYEYQPYEGNESSFEEIKSNVQIQLGYDGNEQNTIRILKQALEEEHAGRAALFLELEKERSAAASAADEAMAMILRQQEEKASVEMEARQYQRIIEEKSAYDAEEMNILKEILVRRELEKHFLEKEVEAYRQMYNRNEQLPNDIPDIVNTERDGLASSFDMGEDPFLMLQQLSESIDMKEIVKNETLVNEVSSFEKEKCSSYEEADISKQGDLDNKFSHMSGSSRKHEFSENTLYLESEDQEQNDNANLPEETETKTIQNHNNVNVVRIPNDGEILEWHRNDAFQGSRCPENMILDMQAHVHDVHVIDGDKNNEPLRDSDASNVHRRSDAQLDASVIERKDGVTDFPSSNWLDTKPNFNRSSSSIMTAGLPPLGGSSCKSTTSDLRRSSMSAVDNERLKIDTEVEWLREKLRIVQEGREKLNFSMEPLEREKLQLQLLEDITRQLREIRQLTEPRKAVRQTSLPLPFSKV